jgi:hypothetical protein
MSKNFFFNTACIGAGCVVLFLIDSPLFNAVGNIMSMVAIMTLIINGYRTYKGTDTTSKILKAIENNNDKTLKALENNSNMTLKALENNSIQNTQILEAIHELTKVLVNNK